MILPLALAAAVAPAPAAPAFAPPLARDILYETEQVHRTPAGAQRFRMVNRLSFARLGGGWRLTLTLVDLSAEAPADAARLFDTAMRPFVGTPIVLRLGANGRPEAPLNADEAWSAIAASMARVARTVAARGGGEPAVAMLRSFAALSGPARDAKLMETADTLIGFDLPALAPGATAPWSEGAGTGGTITLERADADGLAYHLVTRTPLPGQPGPVVEESRFVIDRATGLLVRRSVTRSLGGVLLAEETIRRLR